MSRINFSIDIRNPHWLARLFRCKHHVVHVIEDFYSRYGVQTSYVMCKKCGREAMDISRNCKHVENSFGECIYCQERISKQNCKHKNMSTEPDTDDRYCIDCGEWEDTF